MQKVGLLTFNAWALDGYLKVFWRQPPMWELWPQVLVLSRLTVVFLGIARMLARRWEVRVRSSGARRARNLLLQVDAEAFGHAVQRAAIDPEDLGGARAVAADLLDDVEEIQRRSISSSDGRIREESLVRIGSLALKGRSEPSITNPG